MSLIDSFPWNATSVYRGLFQALYRLCFTNVLSYKHCNCLPSTIEFFNASVDENFVSDTSNSLQIWSMSRCIKNWTLKRTLNLTKTQYIVNLGANCSCYDSKYNTFAVIKQFGSANNLENVIYNIVYSILIGWSSKWVEWMLQVP